MPSIRKKLAQNVNDSKNTRLNIGLAMQQMDWRADYLAHISRYAKIADLMVAEADRLGRPLKVFEAGCGEMWPIRYLYKALQVKKTDIIEQYTGYDMDPDPLAEVASKMWPPGWFEIFNSRLVIRDLTVEPHFDHVSESMDFFISTEVIEHMKPEFVRPWIADAARCMKPQALAYISTPNSDGSNDKLPIDHVYEWRYNTLFNLLEEHFSIIWSYGTFIQMPNFVRAQASMKEHAYFTETQERFIRNRFDRNWQRVIFAAPYPELSNNVNWVLRRK